MNKEEKKDLINNLLIRRLRKISEPIKIQTRIIKKDREKKRIALIDLFAVKNNNKNFNNIYKLRFFVYLHDLKTNKRTSIEMPTFNYTKGESVVLDIKP